MQLARFQGTLKPGIPSRFIPETVSLPPVGEHSEHELRFFLEPRTQRLLMSAARVECVAQMPSMYRNVHNQWIKVTPNGIDKAITPKNPITDLDTSYYRYKAHPLPKPEESSVYDQSTILSFLRFLQDPFIAESLPLQMTRHFMAVISSQGMHIHDAFNRNVEAFASVVADPGGVASILRFQSLTWLWDFLDGYASFCSFLFCFYVTVHFLAYLMGTFNRLLFLPRTSSWGVHLFRAFFPSLYSLLCLGRFNPRLPPGPFGPMAQELQQFGRPPGPDDDDNDDHHPGPGGPTGGVYRVICGKGTGGGDDSDHLSTLERSPYPRLGQRSQQQAEEHQQGEESPTVRRKDGFVRRIIRNYSFSDPEPPARPATPNRVTNAT